MPRICRLFSALLVLSACLTAGPATAETAGTVMPPLTGRWSGMVEELRDGETTRRFPAEVTFAKNRHATLHFPTLKCQGRLSFLHAEQGSYAYKERTAQARCLRGDLVIFRRKKDKLTIDWEHIGRPIRIIIAGSLSQVDAAAR